MPKILIIEDDAAFRTVMRKVLETHGYEMIEAPDGATGVALARAHLPDLIVSDVRMEGGDGYAALVALRQSQLTEAIPFILMSGQPTPAGLRRGMEQGADDYLEKPFSFDGLIAAVQARLNKHQAIERKIKNQLLKESPPLEPADRDKKLYCGVIDGHLVFSCHPVIIVVHSKGLTVAFPTVEEAEAFLRETKPVSAMAYKHDGKGWKVEIVVAEDSEGRAAMSFVEN